MYFLCAERLTGSGFRPPIQMKVECPPPPPPPRSLHKSDFWQAELIPYLHDMLSWQPMRAGVPQGTLLGPLIFLALIDDALRDQRVKRWKYVDDQ